MSSQRDGKRQVPARFIHSVGGQQRAAKPQTKTSKGTKFCRLKASSWKEHNEAPADPARFDPLIVTLCLFDFHRKGQSAVTCRGTGGRRCRAAGIVASLSRPGGNITGVSLLGGFLGPQTAGNLADHV
jgi:hypothetical protein